MAGSRSAVAIVMLLCAATVLPGATADLSSITLPSWASAAFSTPGSSSTSSTTTTVNGVTTTVTSTPGGTTTSTSSSSSPTSPLSAILGRKSGSPTSPVTTLVQPAAPSTTPTSPTTTTPSTTPTTPSSPSTTPSSPASSSTSPTTPSSPSATPAGSAGCPTTGSGNGNDSPYGNYVCPHNTARAQYGASPLTYSATLESYAQNLVNKCVFAHSHGQYGENLYEASGDLATWQNAVSAWMSEASSYDASNPNYEVSGHFTQVVWKGSSSVGCAAANCGEMTIFACEYDPPGNYNNEYAQNVGSYTG